MQPAAKGIHNEGDVAANSDKTEGEYFLNIKRGEYQTRSYVAN